MADSQGKLVRPNNALPSDAPRPAGFGVPSFASSFGAG